MSWSRNANPGMFQRAPSPRHAQARFLDTLRSSRTSRRRASTSVLPSITPLLAMPLDEAHLPPTEHLCHRTQRFRKFGTLMCEYRVDSDLQQCHLNLVVIVRHASVEEAAWRKLPSPFLGRRHRFVHQEPGSDVRCHRPPRRYPSSGEPY